MSPDEARVLLSTPGPPPRPGQRDFRLHLPFVYRVDVPECGGPLQHVVAAFRTNLLRAADPLKTPVLASLLATEYGRALGSLIPRDGRDSFGELDPEWPAVSAQIEAAIKQMLGPRTPNVMKAKLGSAIIVLLKTFGWYYTSPALERVVMAMFDAAVVATWTAFETLAGDLWIAALNDRPDIGIVALNADPGPSDSPTETERKLKVRYEIPVWRLKEWDFDLKGRMGTLLAEKWDFANRVEAREAYRKAFREQKREVDAVFDREAIRHVQALRNVIVHNAGVADAEFVKLVRGHAQLALATQGDRVPLDGRLAVECMIAVQDAGNDLLSLIRNALA